MDAFAGYKRAAVRIVPHVVEVLDPLHIVALAGQKVTEVRCRLLQEATGRRGQRSPCPHSWRAHTRRSSPATRSTETVARDAA
ncbi:MAG: transposase [Bifidobacterium minimum]|nr:transposase [Bifidobacterium minimum]